MSDPAPRRVDSDDVQARPYRSLKVNEGKKRATVPMTEAIVRSLAVSAARGQLRSQQAFTKMLAETVLALGLQKKRRPQTALGSKLNPEKELERP